MMKKSSTFSLLTCAAAVIAVLAATSASVAAQAPPRRADLSGEWQLNRDLSEDAQEKLQSLGAGAHAGGAAHAGRGGHGPGRHGGRAESDGMHAQLDEVFLNAPSSFVLTQDDQQVVLTEPNGRVRTLPTNDRKVKVDGRDVKTRWESNRLVSEITVGNAKVIETYERSPSAPQLIVTARTDMQGRTVSVRRVYDGVTK